MKMKMANKHKLNGFTQYYINKSSFSTVFFYFYKTCLFYINNTASNFTFVYLFIYAI